MIDGCEDNGGITWIGPDIEAERDAVSKPLCRQDPVLFNRPVVAGLHPPLDCTEIGVVLNAVAENTMRGGGFDRRDYAGGGLVVGISRPHRQPVIR